MRELALTYEEEAQQHILEYMEKEIKFDYMEGNRELNLEMTLREAEKIYRANDQVKRMAESGALK